MNSIFEAINNAKRIAVLSHIDEDCDAFGTSLAVVSFVKSKGKAVTYFLSKPIEERIAFLGNDYTVFDKNVDYGAFDTVICLDCGDIKRLGDRVSVFENAKTTINIDHHGTNNNYAKINKVIDDYSSTGEIIFDLLTEEKEEITEEIAKCLYCAIMSDTGALKYSCATPKTVNVIAKLMECGIDHSYLSRLLFDTEKLEVVKLKGRVMNSLMSYFDGKVNVVTIDVKDVEKLGIFESDLGDIVNIPRSIKGTEIAVFLRQSGDTVKISLRSNGKYDVDTIAQKFDGGGHKMAAGARVFNTTIDEVLKDLIKVTDEVING